MPGKWNYYMYYRNGISFYPWWNQNRRDNISQKLHFLTSLPGNGLCTLAYVRIDTMDFKSHKNNALKLIGGQFHVQYNDHNLTLITPIEK